MHKIFALDLAELKAKNFHLKCFIFVPLASLNGVRELVCLPLASFESILTLIREEFIQA